MRCKTCNYSLWQIRDRRCPECGTPFKPSDFEFVCNSVRFCCPHCNQDYYGTGEKGHLVPSSFACVRCSQIIDMDDTVLLPTAGVDEKQTETTVVPWIDRRNRWWFSAFFITMGMAIANPRRLMNAIPETSSFLRALIYGSLHIALQTALNLGAFFMFMGLMSAAAGGGGIFAGVVGAAAALAIVGPVVILLWAGSAHLILRLTGETAHGFGRTHQAIAYSAGNNFLYGIPCIGFYFFWAGALWWAISAGFMLALGQRVRGWRAALAVGVLPAVVILGVIGLITYAFLETRSMVTQAQTQMQARSRASAGVSSLATLPLAEQAAMSQFSVAFLSAMARSDNDVRNIVEIASDDVRPESFEDLRESAPAPIILGGTTLQNWAMRVTPEERTPLIDRAVALTPEGPAYRIGDRVFTHAGIDLSTINEDDGSDRLWLVIGWRRSLTSNGPAETVSVVRADGQVNAMNSDAFAGFLAAQNTLRESFGLPPLLMPDTVREHETAPAAP